MTRINNTAGLVEQLNGHLPREAVNIFRELFNQSNQQFGTVRLDPSANVEQADKARAKLDLHQNADMNLAGRVLGSAKLCRVLSDYTTTTDPNTGAVQYTVQASPCARLDGTDATGAAFTLQLSVPVNARPNIRVGDVLPYSHDIQGNPVSSTATNATHYALTTSNATLTLNSSTGREEWHVNGKATTDASGNTTSGNDFSILLPTTGFGIPQVYPGQIISYTFDPTGATIATGGFHTLSTHYALTTTSSYLANNPTTGRTEYWANGTRTTDSTGNTTVGAPFPIKLPYSGNGVPNVYSNQIIPFSYDAAGTPVSTGAIQLI